MANLIPCICKRISATASTEKSWRWQGQGLVVKAIGRPRIQATEVTQTFQVLVCDVCGGKALNDMLQIKEKTKQCNNAVII